uniref:Uncharacterized protein n=1 Tax=Murine feces-associated hepe-like virus TaxID=2171386 RepID=A0A2S0SYY3_9VIRU|nr:hypothetical protein [Murine feces-associated hepe-like virus]
MTTRTNETYVRVDIPIGGGNLGKLIENLDVNVELGRVDIAENGSNLIKQLQGLQKKPQVIDIASNDSILLRHLTDLLSNIQKTPIISDVPATNSNLSKLIEKVTSTVLPSKCVKSANYSGESLGNPVEFIITKYASQFTGTVIMYEDFVRTDHIQIEATGDMVHNGKELGKQTRYFVFYGTPGLIPAEWIAHNSLERVDIDTKARYHVVPSSNTFYFRNYNYHYVHIQ